MTFHNKWRSFLHGSKKVNLKEEVQRVAENLPWSEESVGSEIKRAKELDGESSVVGGDALGQFIVDHGDGDAQQALNHLEDEIQEMEDEIQEMEMMREAINDLIADEKRQEINDMMDEEEEEIQFAKDNPEYTTRKF